MAWIWWTCIPYWSLPPNYGLLRSTRKGKGGGTATILSNAIDYKDVLFDEYPSFEHHAFVFSRPLILLSMREFSIIHSKYDKIIVLGDFNIHTDHPSDSFSSEFINVINCMNFTQHNTQPTRNRGHTLDLVMTYGLSASVFSVVKVGLSDHFCVFFLISMILYTRKFQSAL